MNIYIPGILFILLGLVMGYLTMHEWAIDNKSGWLFSGIFILLGIAMCVIMYFEAYKWYVAVIGIPTGVFSICGGLGLMHDCLSCSQKIQGTFIRPECHHIGRHRERRYGLLFTYCVDSRKSRNLTEDYYSLGKIEKNFEPHKVYTIYCNPRHPEKIRMRRYQGFILGIIVFIVGISFLGTVVCIIFEIPFASGI